MTPVALLYEMTDAPESDVEETLLLKIVQSAPVIHPNVELFAVAQVNTPAELVRPFPVSEVKREEFNQKSPDTARFVEVALVVVARVRSTEPLLSRVVPASKVSVPDV